MMSSAGRDNFTLLLMLRLRLCAGPGGSRMLPAGLFAAFSAAFSTASLSTAINSGPTLPSIFLTKSIKLCCASFSELPAVSTSERTG